MNDDFVAEMLRATGSVRAGDLAGATALIQDALAGRTRAPGAAAPRRPDGDEPSRRFPGRRLRKSLGEVLRTLRAGRRSLGLDGRARGEAWTPQVPELPLPAGAEFRDLNYAGAAGGRRYRLYVPASATEGLEGLVVMLHGCTQSPEDFAAGTGMNALAEAHRLLVAYPAQTRGDNSMACWNWFRPGDQARGAGEPAIIAGLTERIRDEFGVSRDRVFVAGLSAGGAMAAILAETYPELYAAVGIHSGLAHGSANDVVSAFAAMRGQGGIEPAPTAAAGGIRRAAADRLPRQRRHHCASGQRRADRRQPARHGADRAVRARGGGRDPRLHPHGGGPRRRQPRAGVLDRRRRRPCLVGRPAERVLHRSQGPRRLGGDGAVLPRRAGKGLRGRPES